MAARSPIFRNSDASFRDLERRITTTGDLSEVERYVAALFRSGRLSIPTEPGARIEASVPDTLGRLAGLIVSLRLNKTVSTTVWHSSEDRDLELVEHRTFEEAVVERRRAEREAGEPFGGRVGIGERALVIQVELAQGLHLGYYRHGIMNDIPWNRFWEREALRESQATTDLAIKWIVRAITEVAEHVSHREQAFATFVHSVGADPRIDPVGAYDALMAYYRKRSPSGGHGVGHGGGSWSGALQFLELATPPANPRWLVQTPTASGYGYAWASLGHLRRLLGGMRGVVEQGEPSWARDYGPVATESGYQSWVRRDMNVTSTRARTTEHPLPVEVRYPTLMGLSEIHESEPPVAGRWYIGLGGGQPSTVQELYRVVIDLIWRDFPGAEVFVRDLGRYPTDYEGRRLERGRYH